MSLGSETLHMYSQRLDMFDMFEGYFSDKCLKNISADMTCGMRGVPLVLTRTPIECSKILHSVWTLKIKEALLMVLD